MYRVRLAHELDVLTAICTQIKNGEGGGGGGVGGKGCNKSWNARFRLQSGF